MFLLQLQKEAKKRKVEDTFESAGQNYAENQSTEGMNKSYSSDLIYALYNAEGFIGFSER